MRIEDQKQSSLPSFAAAIVRYVQFLSFAFLVVAAQPCFSPACLAAGDEESDLRKLNGQARAMYATAKAEIRAHLSPVLILTNGKMILFRKGIRTEFVYIPEEWSVLKTADHIVMALFAALTNHTGEKLSDELLARLQEFKRSIGEARDDLQSFKYTPIEGTHGAHEAAISTQRTANRQQLIMNQSLEFLDKVLSERFIRFPDLKIFCTKMARMSMENAYDAVVLELSTIDSKVQEWRKEMGKEEWDRLYVVICGSHMARQQERTTQYFLQLLGQKAEGDRIVYNDAASDENSSMDLLVTHILDGRLGEAFFGEKLRMHRDLLGDAATKYLRSHKPH